jgi:hypothetical protein
MLARRPSLRSAAVSGAVLLGGLFTVGQGQAHGAPEPTITHVVIDQLSVNSAPCRKIGITVSFDPAGQEVDAIDMQIWRGVNGAKDVVLHPNVGADRATDYYKWCPKDGLGEFRAGPSEIDFHAPGGADSSSVISHRVTFFDVKQRSKLILSTTKAKHARTVFHVRLRYWNEKKRRHEWMSHAVLHLQRFEGVNLWVNKAAARTDKNGRATFVRALNGHQWRVHYAGNDKTFGKNSSHRG